MYTLKNGMKTLKTILFVLLFSVLMAACSSLTVTSDFDRSADISKYKTFAFYKLSDKNDALSDLNKNRIVNAIRNQMIAKGFKEVNSGADVLVNATAMSVNKQSVTSTTNVYGYGGYYRPYRWGGVGYPMGNTSYDVRDYKDGSLIIDVLDAKDQNLLWQGIGNKEIDAPSKDPDAVINSGVMKIMERFPMEMMKK